MASIIKVDTLQKPDGTAPTAGDLGIDTAGTVLQVKSDISSTQVTNSTDGWTDMGLSVTITPSSATSYFWVILEGHFSSQNSTQSKGYGFNIYKDGTAVTTSPNDAANRPYDFYQDGTGRFFNRDSKVYYAVTGTTSSVTFTGKFTGYNYSTQGDVKLGTSSETQHTLTVMEISA